MARLLNSSLTFVAPEDLTPSLTASLVLSAGRRLAPVVFAAEALVRTRPQFYLEGVQSLAKNAGCAHKPWRAAGSFF